jgi:hypothetical protein
LSVGATSGGHRHLAAEARGPDGDFRTCHRQIEPLLYLWRFNLLAATGKALIKSMQRPEIIWMLASSAQFAVQTEIGSVYGLGLLEASPFQQQRSESMACWLHPTPGLVIRQVVVEFD